MTTKPVMTFDAWMKEARRAGKHFWCYEELVDDNPEYAKVAWQNGFDPYDYIEREGKRLDLHEFGPAFGGW
jgi:hypothetical protein